MTFVFEELDHQSTPLGDISLRRRSDIRLGNKVLYEVIMGDEFLMSSVFTEAEEQLSRMGLAALDGRFVGSELDVVVGGLGLGYTAVTALENPRVRSLVVVDVMAPVIRWHKEGLVPLGKQLVDDTRCELVHADFFERALNSAVGFDGSDENRQVHAVLLDIDHSPSNWLNAGNSGFYSKEGLHGIADKLRPGGVFGLWSNDAPEEEFMTLLKTVFDSCSAHVVPFDNPYELGKVETNTVYLSHKRVTA